MSKAPESPGSPESPDQQAAAWVVRCDRALTPEEQVAFSEWLAANPQHGVQLARHRRHWSRLDSLAQWLPEYGGQPNPDLLAPPVHTRFRSWAPALALGVAASLAALLWISGGFALQRSVPRATEPESVAVAPASAKPPSSGPRVLEDGTIVELNHEASITVDFTPGERRVRLDRGEAHFVVISNAARPFIVNAGGIDVRAVGTTFNVRINTAAVEVLVTEGRVQLDAVEAAGVDAAPSPANAMVPARPTQLALLEARQRAVVSLAAKTDAPRIATLTAGEIERVLAWQHRLLDFSATPLTEIVAEFNRRNVVQLVIIDPELASIRVSAAVRSDNVAGFVRLLEAGFNARAERRGESEILLRMVK